MQKESEQCSLSFLFGADATLRHRVLAHFQ